MRVLVLAFVVAVLGALPAAAKGPAIHAHRGGPVLAGVATYPEESMPAFRNAAREGWWLELDAKLTKDGVPVVFHDPTLDRTTPCTGELRARTLAELDQCRMDVLGAPGYHPSTKQVPPTEPIPTLAQVLAFAQDEGAFLNLEIKNHPGEADFDSTSAFANRVMDTVVGSGFPKERLIIQSYWPPNLSVADARLPGVETSILTQPQTNDGGPAFASSLGIEWVSPDWPMAADYMQNARNFGRRVVPYTLNVEQEIRDAAAIGVDAFVSDDPLLAQGTLGLTRADLLPDNLRPTAALDAPSYASESSRRPRFPVRLSGDDRGSGIEGFSLDARRNANASPRWRRIAGTSQSLAFVRGRPGVTYLLRLRAHDRLGNLSTYDYEKTTVPFDERAGMLSFGAGWQRIRSKRAWRGTLTRATVPGAMARARVEGERVALIARRSPGGGRLLVMLDGKPRKVVDLRGPRRNRSLVYRSRVLAPGVHRVELKTLGGGPVDLDAFGVDQGPGPPS